MVSRTGRQWSGWAAIGALAGGLAAGCGPGKPADTDDGGSDTETSAGPGGDSEPTTTGVDPTAASGSTDAGSGSEGDSDSGETTAGPDDGKLCVPAPSLVRRLTNAQYHNTLRDLLPGVELPLVNLLGEDQVEGFDNIAESQLPWEVAGMWYVEAATLVASTAIGQADAFLDCGPDGGPDPAGCGHAFVLDFATRAFRRPLTDEEETGLLAAFDDELAADGFLPAIEATLTTVLKSEAFLHLVEVGGAPVEGQPELLALTGFELASRMSYFLWNTMPDPELFDAAAQGSLDTPAGVEAQARRLLADPRARAAIVRYAIQWLYMSRLLEEEGFFPEWLPQGLQVSLRGEIERFLAHVVFDGERTLASLLTSNLGFVDAELAKIYEIPPQGGFAQVELDATRRPGVFTRAGWLVMRSPAERHSPFLRGLSVVDSLFCLQLPPPPPDVTIIPSDDLPPNPTTRELYDTILVEPQCASCHLMPQNIGYGMESYDFLGKWQDEENGKPVDVSGEIDPTLDAAIGEPFVGTAELMQKLAQSEAAQRCSTRKAYLFALGRKLGDADACDLEQLQKAFVASKGDLHELLVQITLSDGFRHRRAE